MRVFHETCPGLSARRYVCVPQDIRFGFQIFQPMLDDVADADDADELAIVSHRQMAHAVIRHQAHRALQAIAGRNLDDGMGHDVRYRQRKRSLSMPRDRVYDVAFGYEALDRIAALYDQRGDTVLSHPVGRALDGVDRADCEDLGAF